MQNIKSSLFLYLTPRQKSQLLGTLKSYFKKFELSSEELVYKFLEDEKYYLDIENPHFEFVKDYLEDDLFFKELKKFFDFCVYEKRQKDLMEPYLDKQKQIAKEINNLGYGQDEELINNATEVFRYYYDKYYSCIGSYHLVLSSKAMRNTLERYINGSEIAIDLQYDIEAYKEMIDRHFTKDYGEEIDYSICHFMTEGIRNYLFYEVLY